MSCPYLLARISVLQVPLVHAVEDLAGVPGAVVGCDWVYAWLRADERTARERDDVLAGGGAVADELLGDEYAVAVVDSEGALVEELVVQGAETQPVVDVVRSSEDPPDHQPTGPGQAVARTASIGRKCWNCGVQRSLRNFAPERVRSVTTCRSDRSDMYFQLADRDVPSTNLPHSRHEYSMSLIA